MSEAPVLELDHVSVRFGTGAPVVANLSLHLSEGECLGIVGESGAGKSLALLAATGLAPAGARISGVARFREISLIGAPRQVLRAVRGRRIAMVFQDPMSSLTPHLRIGTQITETLRAHGRATWRTARAQARNLLADVRITEPDERLDQYPHELSGGMRQRVMIAMALAGEPELMIADEPTTALDVTTQAQILALLSALKRARGLSLALISHDFGVIAGLADRVLVMHRGRAIETGGIDAVLSRPREAYTSRLIADARALDPALRRVAAPPIEPAQGEALISVSALRVSFPRRPRAVDGIELQVFAGESFGILGESGSGKSTLIRAMLQLVPARGGTIVWLGAPITRHGRAAVRRLRSGAQLIFQDPFASLDPSMTVAELVAEPLRIHRSLARHDEQALVRQALADVQLDPAFASRLPHQLSGGQCQRVGIARALVLQPRLLVCDEPMSALDVSVQHRIIALFLSLREHRKLTLVLVSHHLGIIHALCQRALVLYQGRMMECAPIDQLYGAPVHPYTRALLAAIRVPDPQIQSARLDAMVLHERGGEGVASDACVFRMRCPHALEVCASSAPEWETIGPQRQVACHRWRELIAVHPAGGPAILE